jgi:hypothetical protein
MPPSFRHAAQIRVLPHGPEEREGEIDLLPTLWTRVLRNGSSANSAPEIISVDIPPLVKFPHGLKLVLNLLGAQILAFPRQNS